MCPQAVQSPEGVMVGTVAVGGDVPISVQSMTTGSDAPMDVKLLTVVVRRAGTRCAGGSRG